MLAVLKTARAWRARLCAVLAFLLIVVGIAALGRSGLFAADPASTLARREVFLPAALAVPSAPLPVPDLGSQALHGELVSRGYTLDGVRTAEVDVPRMFAARLPPDLADLDAIDLRKQVFVKLMLPLVLAENERILADRERILKLRDQMHVGELLEAADVAWLEAVSARYGIRFRVPEAFTELVRRVDAVPPSLAIGQAALETGWGTSAVAQRGHAVFGQMVVLADGDTLAVRRFAHLAHAVEAYALNLNTHKAYGRFRAKRAEMRSKGQIPDGYELTLALASYSERKSDYIRDVRGIIRVNRLRPLDAARLGG
jgi:Bax protein